MANERYTIELWFYRILIGVFKFTSIDNINLILT